MRHAAPGAWLVLLTAGWLSTDRPRAAQPAAATAAEPVVIWLADRAVPADTDSTDTQPLDASGAGRTASDSAQDANRAARTRARLARLAERRRPAQDTVRAAVGAAGGQVTHGLTVVNALVARLAPEARAAVEALPEVWRIEPARRYEARLDIGVASLGAAAFWNAGFTGGSADIGSVDSGVAASHPAFAPRSGSIVSRVFHATAVLDSFYADNPNSSNDLAGHGTAVAGMPFSQGDTMYPSRRGVAYGADRFYNLKAAFALTGGSASLYDPDAMVAVDWAMNAADPPEVINMSYGSQAFADDGGFERFWDAVADAFSVVVTLPGGNVLGPTPGTVDSPSIAYNAISVANVNDRRTSSRVDDVIASTSALGPTLAGRKKPDLSAPGTSILSPTPAGGWQPFSGTSLSAPLVAGLATLLFDGGLTDARAVKAVLINSAEDRGPDGWDGAFGWGYANATAAFAERTHARTVDLTPAAGSVKLFEQVAAQPSKMTAAWHRHIAYGGPGAPPSGGTLNNVDLRLFDSATGTLRASSTSTIDNVEQVANTAAEGVVLEVRNAGSFTGTSERVGLASAAALVPRNGPAVEMTLSYPTLVSPGATFVVQASLRNTGDLRGHRYSATLTPPAGFTVGGEGPTIQLGSLDAGAIRAIVWTVTAPAAPAAPASFGVSASTISYGTTTSFAASASITAAPSTLDADGDMLPDAWESDFGLDPSSGSGPDGPSGDPDGDGRTNATELMEGTHPRGTTVRYLAEGATGAFLSTRLARANPTASTARVLVRFAPGDGPAVLRTMALAPWQRGTLDVQTVPGLGSAEFATTIEADQPVVVDRTMSWDATGYGSHADMSVPAPALQWYFAEGATHSGFDFFLLLYNPGTQAASVRVRFLQPRAAPLERTWQVAAGRRLTIWVDRLTFGGVERLANADVSMVVESLNDTPIIAERAMYLSTATQLFKAGHESAGVTAPATSWFFAEGATGSYFDLFLLVGNVSSREAQLRATYLLPDGTSLTKDYTVPPESRFNIWVDNETFGPQGLALADTAVATVLTSLNDVPVVAERAMWWPGPTSATWHEAHVAVGATATGTQWAVADGEVGGAQNSDTYLLVANTGTTQASVRVTLLFESTDRIERTLLVAPQSRFNVDVRTFFPAARDRRFGAIVESLGPSPAPIVVERAMYRDSGAAHWAAGTGTLAVRVR